MIMDVAKIRNDIETVHNLFMCAPPAHRAMPMSHVPFPCDSAVFWCVRRLA
jgi:hypothetical protein